MLQGKCRSGAGEDHKRDGSADCRSSIRYEVLFFIQPIHYYSTPFPFRNVPTIPLLDSLGSLLVASLLRTFSRFDVMKRSRFCCADAHPLCLCYISSTRSRSLSYSPPTTIVKSFRASQSARASTPLVVIDNWSTSLTFSWTRDLRHLIPVQYSHILH